MLALIISLQRCTDRRAKITKRLTELGIPWQIFDAIEGKSLSHSERRYNGTVRRLMYGKDMTDGEIGCALSHIAVCKKIASDCLENVLILEDDAIIQDTLPETLNVLSATSSEWDLVRFLASPKVNRRTKLVVDLGGGMSLGRVYGTPGGAYGYVVNHKAAAKISALGDSIYMPIDTLHGQVWRHRLKVRCLTPSPILPDYDVYSTIGNARFSKKYNLSGWERAVFPFTHFGFKTFDAAAKHATFWLGYLSDFKSY